MAGDSDAQKLSPEEERARAVALLEATHTFPVHYEVSVITFTSEEIFASVRAAAGLDETTDEANHQMVASRAGKYTSHRLRVPCASPVAVLDLYARLRAVTGVVTLI